MSSRAKTSKIIDFPRVKTACAQCSLAELCLPRGLSQTDLEHLEATVKPPRPLAKHKTLFRAGTAFDSFYVVRSGSAKLTYSAKDGDEQIIGFYLPGELLGLDGVESGRHTCTATALEMSSICKIPYDQLTRACQLVPSLHRQMNRIVGRELNNENRHLLLLNKKNAEQRMATFLLSMSSRFARLGYSPVEFHLSMSRQELGDFLGLALETVSRVLGRFQKSGLITIQRRLVRIRDLGGLDRLCTDPDAPLCGEQS